jgi:hypothetical protein
MIEIFDNIRKLYRFSLPTETLSPFIEFFSETDLLSAGSFIQDKKFTVKLFPSFTPTIWMNLGSPYRLHLANTAHQIDERTDVLVLRSQTIERENAPTDNIFTVKFLPGASRLFLASVRRRSQTRSFHLMSWFPLAKLTR